MTIWMILAAAVPLGLFTSVHCVGMCGGLILAVGGAFNPEDDATAKKGWAPHIVYHTGRLITYASLGAAAGAAGTLIQRIGSLAGFQHATMAITILILLLVAAHLMGWLPIGSEKDPGSGAAGFLGRMLRGVSGVPGAFVLGIFTGFLPCSPLYGALALSVATKHPVYGAVSMAAFWAGTVPLLLVLGHSGRVMLKRLRGNTAVAVAILIITVAVTLTAFKMAMNNDPTGMLSGKGSDEKTEMSGSGHK